MIVLFVPPGHHDEYAHRITSVAGSSDRPILTTKGDANRAVDPWHAEIVAPTVSRVVGSVPDVGRVLVALRGAGQILLAVLGGLVVAWASVRWALSPQRPSGRRTPVGST